MIQRRHLLALAALAGCASRSTTAGPLGWAGVGGTTGGSAARPEHVFEVHDRAGLAAALALGDTPKLIRLHRRITLGVSEAACRDPAFSPEAFDRAFDPATWGRADPAGPLEDARRRSARRQAAAVTVRLPSNTTLVGAAPGAGFDGGMLLLEGVRNIVLAHLHLSDAYDHFPEWQPRDNGHGEWNSEYDSVSLRQAEQVWVNHCAFDDGSHPDALEPTRLGRPVQRHDGLLDITRRSDRVTVSHCRFADHDKTMLIGSGDSRDDDAGRLRVTLHHNHFHNCRERTPRVRFGQVHVVANLFSADTADRFGYSLGIGHRSQLFSEFNAWELPPGIGAQQLLRPLKGTAFFDRGSRLNGQPADLAAGHGLSPDVGWRPDDAYSCAALRPPHPPALPAAVRASAGPRLGENPAA